MTNGKIKMEKESLITKIIDVLLKKIAKNRIKELLIMKIIINVLLEKIAKNQV